MLQRRSQVYAGGLCSRWQGNQYSGGRLVSGKLGGEGPYNLSIANNTLEYLEKSSLSSLWLCGRLRLRAWDSKDQGPRYPCQYGHVPCMSCLCNCSPCNVVIALLYLRRSCAVPAVLRSIHSWSICDEMICHSRYDSPHSPTHPAPESNACKKNVRRLLIILLISAVVSLHE